MFHGSNNKLQDSKISSKMSQQEQTLENHGSYLNVDQNVSFVKKKKNLYI